MITKEELRQIIITLHSSIRIRLVHFQNAIGLKLALIYQDKVQSNSNLIRFPLGEVF